MAGRGPAPKPAGKLVGHGASKARDSSTQVFAVAPAAQPSLEFLIGEENPLTDAPWRRSTLLLWEQLGEFPTTELMQDAQWSSLARAMCVDDAFMSGEVKLAGESRLRLAKYGVDPDDLARLRIQFAAADEADDKRGRSASGVGSSSRARRGPLKAV